MTDLNEMLLRLPADDPQVIEALVACYQGYVYSLCLSILDDPMEADDAAQETLIRAAASLGSYRVGTQMKSWLAAIAVNYCRDLLRRKRARSSLHKMLESVERLVGHHPGVEETVIQNQSRSALWNQVQALSEKHRLPVILRFVHGLTAHEIAAVLGVREGTVHSRLHYALGKLHESALQSREALTSAAEEGGSWPD